MPRKLTRCVVVIVAFFSAQMTIGEEPSNPLLEKPGIGLLKQYCFECHSGDAVEGEIDLPNLLSPDAIVRQRVSWHKLREVVAFGAMPPEDAKRPSADERKQLIRGMDALFAEYPTSDEDGRPITARRLNRAEYNNTVRELLGTKLKPADDFPSDEVGDGFDNNASVLTLPTLLLEKYLDAAERLADEAIVTPAEQKDLEIHKEIAGDALKTAGPVKQDSFVRHQLQPGGSVSGRFEIPANGRYRLSVSIWTEDTSPFDKPLEVRNDQGELLKSFSFNEKVEGRFRDEIDLSAGPITLTARLPEGATPIGEAAGDDNNRRPETPVAVISELQIDGPMKWTKEMLPETHRQLMIVYPETKLSIKEAAQRAAMRLVLSDEEVKRYKNVLTVADAATIVMRSFIRRAFRCRVEDADVQPYVAIVEQAVGRGKPFEEGVEIAVTAVLVSPRFLYRLESLPIVEDEKHQTPQQEDGPTDLNAYQLASRLSYFLWSSMPDDRLFELADQGSILEPAVLRQEVARMISDKRADALFDGFASQWLGLRNLSTVTPDTERFRTFNEELRADMLQETRLVFLDVLRNGKSVLELLNGQTTFVNQRLAEHYGIQGITGTEFVQTAFKDVTRAGLLGQASILTLTSNPGRTSPVKRGKWVMENLLGTPPPEPPANVISLEESAKSVAHLPLRNQLELHRADPACAACHRYMDAIGFGLENFDGVGQWRVTDQGNPIDNAGDLPNGDHFSGPVELAEKLRASSGPAFAGLVADRLLTYALGRGLTKADQLTIHEIIQTTQKDEFPLNSVIAELVLSPPFRQSHPTLAKEQP